MERIKTDNGDYVEKMFRSMSDIGKSVQVWCQTGGVSECTPSEKLTEENFQVKSDPGYGY